MDTKEKVYIGLSAALIVFQPLFLSSTVVSLVDSLLGRAILLGFVVLGITMSSLAGIMGFLAAASLFTVRNHHSIFRAKNTIMNQGSKLSLSHNEIVQSTPAPVNGTIHDDAWVGNDGEHNGPDENDTFDYNGVTENSKNALEPQPFPNSQANLFYIKNSMPVADHENH